MNAWMRSRRDSTSGEGLKSTVERYRSGALLGDPAVAAEELALGLQQPGELDVVDVGQGTLQDAGALAPCDLRGERQEELVRQAGLANPAVQGGPTLAE